MLLFGHDQAVARWVAERIPHVRGGDFGPCTAIGVVRHGQMAAGVVFHDYQPGCGTIQLSCAAASPLWATRRTVKALLSYPFEQLGANKVWTATPAGNARALKFNQGIGMRQEAVLRHHFGRDHAVVMSMLAKEYRRLYAEV